MFVSLSFMLFRYCLVFPIEIILSCWEASALENKNDVLQFFNVDLLDCSTRCRGEMEFWVSYVSFIFILCILLCLIVG
jgi:hypothetical protein